MATARQIQRLAMRPPLVCLSDAVDTAGSRELWRPSEHSVSQLLFPSTRFGPLDALIWPTP